MTDAKEMWDAIKSRYGGNDESKKMQKYILKQQFKGFSVSNSEGLHKGYDSGHDLNENEKVLQEGLGSKATNLSKRTVGNQDIRRRDAWNSGNKDGSRTGQKEDSKALVTIDGEGVDWTNHSEDEDYALMACNNSDSEQKREQLSDASIEIKAYSQGLKKVEAQLVCYNRRNACCTPTHDRELYALTELEVDYSQFTYGPKQTQPSESESQSSEFDTCESNISTEPSELVSEPVVNESNVECQPKVWSDAPIIEEYESDSEDEYVSIPTKQQETPSFANQQVKTPRENVKSQFTHSQKPKVDKKDLGYGFTVRACFVCGSLNHLIRDCDFHEKRMARKANLNILTRTGKIPVNTARASGTKNVSTARQSFNRQTVLTSTAMKVNTVKPTVNRVRPANVFHKTHSPYTRPFKKTTVLRTVVTNQKLNTAKVNAVSTVGGQRETAVKSSAGIVIVVFQAMNGSPGLSASFKDFMVALLLCGGITGGLACLIAKATTDESNKWHRRLGHVNFKNLNKLVKGNLVRGLPSKLFQNDHTCVACQKGKQHKASCKAKTNLRTRMLLNSVGQKGSIGNTIMPELYNKMELLRERT
ncbi:putative ribonuclease H-like domain-containing protein [Tanacetum coccineum]